MTGKQRLTVTVDPELVEAGNEAVAAGLASSLSAWVNAALTASMVRDRRLRSLAAAVADFEQQHGQISSEEIASQRRVDRAGAVVVRGSRGSVAEPVARKAAPGKRRRTGAA